MVKSFIEFRALIDEILSVKLLTLDNIEQLRIMLKDKDPKQFGEFEEDAREFIKKILDKLPDYYKAIRERDFNLKNG
jgi:hypothetical protein